MVGCQGLAPLLGAHGAYGRGPVVVELALALHAGFHHQVGVGEGDLLASVLLHHEGVVPGCLSLLARSIAILFELFSLQQLSLSYPHLLVVASIERYGVFDYDKASPICAMGSEQMRKALAAY